MVPSVSASKMYTKRCVSVNIMIIKRQSELLMTKCEDTYKKSPYTSYLRRIDFHFLHDAISKAQSILIEYDDHARSKTVSLDTTSHSVSMTQLIDYALGLPEKRMETLFHKENGPVHRNMVKARSAVKKANSCS